MPSGLPIYALQAGLLTENAPEDGLIDLARSSNTRGRRAFRSLKLAHNFNFVSYFDIRISDLTHILISDLMLPDTHWYRFQQAIKHHQSDTLAILMESNLKGLELPEL